MKTIKLIYLLALAALAGCSGNGIKKDMIGDRINGPANVRDTINGKKVLFTLDDNTLVECTDKTNGWYTVGVEVLLNSKQYHAAKLAPGDTLFDTQGNKVGIAQKEVELWFTDEIKNIRTGFIAGYTHHKNIKPETIIENAIAKVINGKDEITLDDLMPIIKSFRMETCSSSSMGDEKGHWYYYSDNIIDDPSPRDRITFIIENNRLVGIVHKRRIKLENKKTIKLIRDHNFTPIMKMTKSQIQKIVDERLNWYRTVD